jgi:hypothetical protein
MDQNEELLKNLSEQNQKLIEMVQTMHHRMFAQLIVFGAFMTNYFNRSEVARAEFAGFAQDIREGAQAYLEKGFADPLDIIEVEKLLTGLQGKINPGEDSDMSGDFPEFLS